MIFGDLGGLKFPGICLTGEEKPREKLTQETSPDRGSNPGPLCDKRACYHLLRSGGLFGDFKLYYYYFIHSNLCICLLQYAHAVFQKTYLIKLLYSINIDPRLFNFLKMAFGPLWLSALQLLEEVFENKHLETAVK